MFSSISLTVSSSSPVSFSGLSAGSMKTSVLMYSNGSATLSSSSFRSLDHPEGAFSLRGSKSYMIHAGWWFCLLHQRLSMLKTTSMESYGNQSTNVPDFSSMLRSSPFGAVGSFSRWAICSCLSLSLEGAFAFSFAFGILLTAPMVGRLSTSSPTTAMSGARCVSSWGSITSSCGSSASSSFTTLGTGFGLPFALVHRIGMWYNSKVHGSQNVTQPPVSRVMTQVCSTSLMGSSSLSVVGFFPSPSSSTSASLLSLVHTVPLHT
mmetsp:Transcript_85847/g.228165  ORF Transcript_85847/g.228165 Transcript_85847/m.228165 type:complete len:264 (-) Transcript_85847:1935-2726(-)